MSIIDGSFHVLFAVKQIAIKNGLNEFDYESVKAHISAAIEVVKKVYLDEIEIDDNFSSNRFFKDTRTKDKITREVG